MRRLALVALAALLVLLAASQILLPRLAEREVRSELEPIARVLEADVDAVPALTLLADRADAARVRVGAARASAGDLGDLVASTERTDALDARAESLRLGPLDLRDLRLRKDGARLEGRAVLPAQAGLRPVASEGGELVFEATAGLLGGARARLAAVDGALVVVPEGLLGALATLTVFSHPRIEMTGVAARATRGGYALTATGRLR